MDEHGRGVAAFTVANKSGRSVRARASVSPFAPASADWFKIEGDAERLMPPGASENYTVMIAVRGAAGAGQRSFRLDIASIDRPSDEWAHGPAVRFDLAEGGELAVIPGYVETVIGALIGSLAALVLAAIAGVVAWVTSGYPIGFLAVIVRPFSLPIFAGDLVVGVALGGAIGIFGMLTLRSILKPTPWRTAVVYIVVAVVLATVLEVVLELLIPIRTARTSIFFGFPQASPLRDVLAVVLAFVAAAVAALVARAFTRWQILGAI